MSMDSFPASIPHQVPQVGLKTSSSQPSEAQQHHSPGSQNSQSRSSTLAALLIELTSYGGKKWTNWPLEMHTLYSCIVENEK